MLSGTHCYAWRGAAIAVAERRLLRPKQEGADVYPRAVISNRRLAHL